VSILTALANLGKQTAPNPVQGNPAPVTQPAFPFAQPAPQQNASQPPPSFPPLIPPIPGFAAPQAVPPAPPAVPVPPTAPIVPAAPVPGQDLMTQLIQAIASGLIPPDQGMSLLAAMAANKNAGSMSFPVPQAPAGNAANPPAPQNGPAPPDRFEQNSGRYRGRSRSPEYGSPGRYDSSGYGHRRGSPDRRSPPRRRDSPTYGAYEPGGGPDRNNGNRNDREAGRGRGRFRGGRNEFRQRTPPRRPSSPSAPRGTQPKFIDWDPTMPRDHIKVLSRTLFVGGANGSEAELREIFNRFGTVQTCIVNHDKRHAFVKMVNRRDAVAAKEAMDRASHDSEITAKARQASNLQIYLREVS
jgi:protein NRD1